MCPTLLLRGDSDPIVSDKDLQEETSEYLKKSNIVTTPNAGFVVFVEQKEQFLGITKKFVEK